MPDFGVEKQILFLSYDGLSDPLGGSQILPYLCGLSEKGYTISIISFEKAQRFETSHVELQKLCIRYKLTWKPLKYHKYPPVLSTLFDLYNLKRLAIQLHRERNFSIIHCRSYLPSLIGLWMKKKFGVKFLFDMRGFWADERVDGGLWNLRNPVYKIIYNYFKEKERQFLTNSDYVISLTQNAKKEMLTWGISTPIAVIPCCVDLEHFDPDKIQKIQKDNLRQELKIRNEEFVLLYLGSIGTWYLLKEMLDFFYELKKIREQVKFLFVTPDKLPQDKYKYENDIIVSKVTRENVPLYISIADASIMFIKPVFSKKASSATKMGEALAMNVPIVTNSDWGDVSLYEKEFTDFIVVHKQEDYLKAINALVENKIDSNAAREKASKYFSLDKGVAIYDSIYEYLMLSKF